MGNVSMNYAVEARLDAVHDDDGLSRYAGYDPPRTSRLEELALKLRLVAAASERTRFELVLDPLGERVAEKAVASWRGGVATVRAGIDPVLAGGWDQKTWDARTVLVNPYVRYAMPWAAAKDPDARSGPVAAPALAVAADVAGFVATAQVLDDVVASEDAAANSRARKQPATLFELVGSGDTWRPLLQAGVYDQNHSSVAALGLAVRFGGLTAHADAVVDRRKEWHAHAVTHDFNVYRSVAVAAAYDFGAAAAFAEVAAFDDRQAVDHAGNAPGAGLDDDARAVMVGARYALDGDAFAPFAAVTRTSGRFLAAAAPADGPAATRTGTVVRVGVTSRF